MQPPMSHDQHTGSGRRSSQRPHRRSSATKPMTDSNRRGEFTIMSRTDVQSVTEPPPVQRTVLLRQQTLPSQPSPSSPPSPLTNAAPSLKPETHAQTLYLEICEFERQTKRLIPDSVSLVDELELRLRLVKKYSSLIKLDVRLNKKYDLDSRLWKMVAYPLVQHLRSKVKESPLDETSRLVWISWISSMQDIYTDLIECSGSASESILHRALNSLGDLKRYRAQLLTKDRAEKIKFLQDSRHTYMLASQAAPENGFYQSQIAGVTAVLGFPIEAIFYYLGSLCSKFPFKDARESLCSIISQARVGSIDNITNCFQSLIEILVTRISVELFRKKLDQFNLHLEDAMNKLNHTKSDTTVGHSLTGKIYFYMGMITMGTMYLIKQQSINHLLRNQLIADSSALLLTLIDHASRMVFIKENLENMLYIMALNESVLFFLSPKDELMIENGFSWKAFNHIQLNMENFLGADKSAVIVPHEYSLADIIVQFPVPEDAIMAMFSIFNSTHGSSSCGKTFAMLASDGQPNYQDLLLVHYQRFLALQRHLPQPQNLNMPIQVAKHPTRQNTRVGAVHDQEDDKIKVISFEELTNDSLDDTDRWEDQHSSALIESLKDLTNSIPDDIDLQELKAARDNLETRAEKNISERKHVQERLDPTKTVLVLDTNCYLHDYFEAEAILTSRKWRVLIPLAVVTELTGLQSKEGGAGENAALTLDLLTSIFDSPGSAVSDLKNTFVRIITGRGSLLQTMVIRSEEWSLGVDQGGADSRSPANRAESVLTVKSADDLILKVCLNYGKASARTDDTSQCAMPASPLSWSSSTVILVTRDVNMRLKAWTLGIPVVDSVSKIREINPPATV
ncbi:hypothetical protein BASA83_008012 [Batrachochytrium salamandrivorans]|nr:hypothetical protein BASA83_008012 [Batrachochytrium salamandrivorans]